MHEDLVVSLRKHEKNARRVGQLDKARWWALAADAILELNEALKSKEPENHEAKRVGRPRKYGRTNS